MKKNLVIIPAYNERKNISLLSKEIMELNVNVDILFVDGNSTDGTKKILRDLEQNYSNIKVIYESKKEGLAKAYIKGFRYAIRKSYKYTLQMDADFQHHPKYIPKLFQYLKHNDLVIGARDLNIKNIIKFIPIRIKISTVANFYINLITGMRLKDTLGGFKCYKTEVLKSINWNLILSKGYIFQTETVYRIWKQGHKLYEFPITFYPRKSGNSKISFKIFLEGLWRVLQFKIINLTVPHYFKIYP